MCGKKYISKTGNEIITRKSSMNTVFENFRDIRKLKQDRPVPIITDGIVRTA
jgi:hypothetical protein